MNHQKPIPRESLSTLLWGESPPERSQKSLRQAFWQLRRALSGPGERTGAARILRIDPGWAQLVTDDQVRLDVVEFERAAMAQRGSVESTAHRDPKKLAEAVQLYRGDLLEGSYQDWCFAERDRLRQVYLAVLDRLVIHSEEQGQLEAGIAYGSLALRVDPARERTHRALMRLFTLAGDRTAGLRQYERCSAALRDELDVSPDDDTRALERAIRDGHPIGAKSFAGAPPTSASRFRQGGKLPSVPKDARPPRRTKRLPPK